MRALSLFRFFQILPLDFSSGQPPGVVATCQHQLMGYMSRKKNAEEKKRKKNQAAGGPRSVTVLKPEEDQTENKASGKDPARTEGLISGAKAT
jgi:hypothetical protein